MGGVQYILSKHAPIKCRNTFHGEDTALPCGRNPYQEFRFDHVSLLRACAFGDDCCPDACCRLLQDLEVRLFARRHAFAGYTRVSQLESTTPADADAARGRNKARSSQGPSGLVAIRHHAIDWNYVGKARPRPNKWRVEMGPGGHVWKEWGFAQVC